VDERAPVGAGIGASAGHQTTRERCHFLRATLFEVRCLGLHLEPGLGDVDDEKEPAATPRRDGDSHEHFHERKPRIAGHHLACRVARLKRPASASRSVAARGRWPTHDAEKPDDESNRWDLPPVARPNQRRTRPLTPEG